MRRQVYVCDHCGTEFNPINGYCELKLGDLDFLKEIDLCTDCYQELCDIIREFINKDKGR